MRKSRLSPEQILQALRQPEAGTVRSMHGGRTATTTGSTRCWGYYRLPSGAAKRSLNRSLAQFYVCCLCFAAASSALDCNSMTEEL